MNLSMKVKAQIVILSIAFLQMQCASLKQMANLRNCEFRYEGIERISLAGIDLSGIKSLHDLGFINSGKILEAGSRGSLIADLNIKIGARNPNSSLAAMNRLEYIVLLDGNQLLNGSLDQRIEIPAKGETTFSVEVKTDLLKALQYQSTQSLINLALNLADEGQTVSHITIKVKPAIAIGSGFINYPGYITLNKDFKSH